jgi:hypothetical protein
MGLLDRAKRLFGLGTPADDHDTSPPPPAPAPAAAGKSPLDSRLARKKGARPPLADAPQGDTRGVDDALAAREAGDPAEARRIFREIDRGGGLRTVLRAAAALEAGDERELADLLPRVAAEEPRWRLLLQVAAALDDPAAASPLLQIAEHERAPAWALAWARALSADGAAQRQGLVELLFADPALARTIAARDLHIEGAAPEAAAMQRYTSFAHGRDSIRRFGAAIVADLLTRAERRGAR